MVSWTETSPRADSFFPGPLLQAGLKALRDLGVAPVTLQTQTRGSEIPHGKSIKLASPRSSSSFKGRGLIYEGLPAPRLPQQGLHQLQAVH